MSTAEAIELLQEFITIEEKELRKVEPSNAWYAMHWHMLQAPIKKAHRLVDEGTFRQVYFHALRHDVPPGKEVVKYYPVLMRAYRDQDII